MLNNSFCYLQHKTSFPNIRATIKWVLGFVWPLCWFWKFLCFWHYRLWPDPAGASGNAGGPIPLGNASGPIPLILRYLSLCLSILRLWWNSMATPMLSRTGSMRTCGGFYARLACSSHTKSSQIAFRGRLVWLVNFINEDESAILLPMKTRSFKICLR